MVADGAPGRRRPLAGLMGLGHKKVRQAVAAEAGPGAAGQPFAAALEAAMELVPTAVWC